MKLKEIKSKIENADKKKVLENTAHVLSLGGTYVVKKGYEGTKTLMRNRVVKNHEVVSVEEYNSKAFHIPNVLVIVDDAQYKKYDELKDAAGLITTVNKTEIFEMYDEFARETDLEFLPQPTVGGVYFMDAYNRKRFIKAENMNGEILDQIFSELEKVAINLGAREYSIDIVEAGNEISSKKQSMKGKADIKFAKVDASVTNSENSTMKSQNLRHVYQTLKKSKTPKRPDIVWLKNDPKIMNLISSVIDDKIEIEHREFEFACAAFLSKTTNTTANIGASIKKLGGTISADLISKQEAELTRIIKYDLKF